MHLEPNCMMMHAFDMMMPCLSECRPLPSAVNTSMQLPCCLLCNAPAHTARRMQPADPPCMQVSVSAASLHIVLAHYEEDAAHMASLLNSILYVPAIASISHEVRGGCSCMGCTRC